MNEKYNDIKKEQLIRVFLAISLISVKDKIAVILNFFVDCLKFYGILLF